MMKISMLILGGALLFSSASVVHPAWSQGAPIVPVKVTPHILPIRNVPASLMAYWLDPRNHSALTNEQIARTQPPGIDIKRMTPSTAKAPASGVFVLPQGIERIDVQGPNSLSVVGTDEAVEELKDTIAFLDRRLRQVEIEAQLVEMSPNDAKAFGIDTQGREMKGPNDVAKGRTPLLSFPRSNVPETLSALEIQGRAKVLCAQRVTAINNLTATMSQTVSQPVIIGTQDAQGHFQPLLTSEKNAQGDRAPFYLGTAWNWEVTPTINNDGTITMLYSFGTALQLQPPKAEPIALQNKPDLQSIINTRDGETIVISGLDMRLPQDARTSPDKAGGKQLFLFITARILRRIGEKNKA